MLKKLFAPGNDSLCTNLALLILRLWLGLTMLLNHGLGKLTGFSTLAPKFGDPLGLGPTFSLALVVFAEFFASILLALGLVTRFASLVLVTNMSVAFFLAHHAKLSGDHNGEVAFIYLSGYVVLLIAGGGRFSLDRSLFARAAR